MFGAKATPAVHQACPSPPLGLTASGPAISSAIAEFPSTAPIPVLPPDQPRQPPVALCQTSRVTLDRSELQFARHLFLQYHAEYGPFTVDACCDDLGANAHIASKYFCPSRSFLLSDVAGETVWLHPPCSKGLEFIAHYLACKARQPSSTSAVLVLPDLPNSPWAKLVAPMQLLHTYPASSKTLFTTESFLYKF